MDTSSLPSIDAIIRAQDWKLLRMKLQSGCVYVVEALEKVVHQGHCDALDVVVPFLPNHNKTIALKSNIPDPDPGNEIEDRVIQARERAINKLFWASMNMERLDITVRLLDLLDQDTHRAGIERLICEMLLQHKHVDVSSVMKHVNHPERLNWVRLLSTVSAAGDLQGLKAMLAHVPHSLDLQTVHEAGFWSVHNGHLDCVKELLMHFGTTACPDQWAKTAAENGHLEIAQYVWPQYSWKTLVDEVVFSVLKQLDTEPSWAQLLESMPSSIEQKPPYITLSSLLNQGDHPLGVRTYLHRFGEPETIWTFAYQALSKGRLQSFDELLSVMLPKYSERDTLSFLKQSCVEAITANHRLALAHVINNYPQSASLDMLKFLREANQNSRTDPAIIDLLVEKMEWNDVLKAKWDRPHPRLRQLIESRQLNDAITQTLNPSIQEKTSSKKWRKI